MQYEIYNNEEAERLTLFTLSLFFELLLIPKKKTTTTTAAKARVRWGLLKLKWWSQRKVESTSFQTWRAEAWKQDRRAD